METDKLIKIIEPKVITSNRSYWAMHACSFLEYFYEHKNSEVNFSRLEKRNLPLTMASLKSESSEHFISQMRRYFRNWGFQYFLVHYLRTDSAENVVEDLVAFLSDIHNVDLTEYWTKYGWFVTGSDSRSGNRFIKSEDAPLLGADQLSLCDYEEAKNTDLCFRLRYEEESLRSDEVYEWKQAILGEVEGKWGSSINSRRYWEHKPELSQFGFGVSKKIDRNQIEVVRTARGDKVVVTLSSQDNVVSDFNDTLAMFDWVFHRRHSFDEIPRWFKIAGLSTTIEYLIDSMHLPVYEVIADLRRITLVAGKAEDETNDITMPSVPTIIT
ncbi:hypothetical protein [Photobacterium swingsii]|uniref:hypothetical protein n=1 Tax=Photobacterium swingsii TaxID=680026 RepID=UPI004069442F